MYKYRCSNVAAISSRRSIMLEAILVQFIAGLAVCVVWEIVSRYID